MAGIPIKPLVNFWNEEISRAIDTIAPEHPFPNYRARMANIEETTGVTVEENSWLVQQHVG